MARLGFIRKVYGILSVQLAITVIWCWLATTNEGVQNFINTSTTACVLMYILGIGTLCTILCYRDLVKIVPYNYLLLFGFTLAEAYVVGTFCMEYDPTIVLIAAVMTLGVTIALTAYACLTNQDITLHMGGTLIALLCLLFLIIISLFVDNYLLETAISALGVFVYGMYIIIDTQIIADGHSYSISTEDYVIGALILYIDIMRMFMMILRALGRNR